MQTPRVSPAGPLSLSVLPYLPPASTGSPTPRIFSLLYFVLKEFNSDNFISFFFFFLAAPRDLRDLSFPTRDGTRAPPQ